MALGASFVVAMAIAFVLVRRTQRFALWLGLAALVFCVAAGIAWLAGDPRTERVAARLYDQGKISWNDYRAAVAAEQRGQVVDGIAGALAVAFCFAAAAVVRRARA